MSASDDYTIESSTRYNIETFNELRISRIGEFYGYEDTNIDPAGIRRPNTSILVTNFQAVPTTSAPFTAKLYYVVDNDDEASATEITTLPFRLSDISNCRIRVVADNNEDGNVKMTFVFYSSILLTESFVVETNPSYITNAAYTKDYCAIQWNYTHINYAPTINSVNIDLSATSVEKIKTETDGITVASIIGRDALGYNEPNSLDTRGLALVGATYTDADGNSVPSVGVWQYKAAAAPSWSDVVFNETGKAYYFKEQSGYSLRFYPVDNKAVFARLSFRAWDSYSGAEGYQAALGSGGNAPTSTAVASVTIPIEKVNYRPILGKISYTPPSINEDVADVSNSGVVLGTAFFDDIGLAADTDPKRGIVVTGVNDNGNGTWQFYNGSVWTDINKTELNAIPSRPLHLAESTTTAIRFRPAKDKNGTASFTYSAWSQLNGLANYTYAALDGGLSYSEQSASGTLTINAVEDPPDFSGNNVNLLVRSYNQAVFPSTVTDGINVANTILPNYTIVDVDSSANEYGIVLTAFSISGDVTGVSFAPSDFRIGFNATATEWGETTTEIAMSSLTSGTGIYVNRASSFRIRTPATFVGRLIFTFYLWNERVLDGSIATKNRVVSFNYSSLTNKEHYSVSTASFRVFFSDINDPPVLVSPASLSLNTATGSARTQQEDTTAPMETTINQIIGRLTITDADSATKTIPIPGLAFYAVSVNAPDFAAKTPPVTDYGSWYVRKTGGLAVELTDLSRNRAYHVAGDNDGTTLFFKPAGDIYGTFTIKAFVWDRSNEDVVSVYSYADASNTSETSSYSVASVDLQVTVSPVNDQPELQPVSTVGTRINYPVIQMTTIPRTISNSVNVGELLRTLLDQIRPVVIDKDPLDTFGIVITSSNNYFDYSISEINGVPQWTTVRPFTHLRPTDTTRIRLRPIPTIPQTQILNILIWDMTNGIQNGTITTINNTTKSYSSVQTRIIAKAT